MEAAFGQEGEAAVLGATALEGLGLIVDPVAKKLIPRDLLALGHRAIRDPSGENTGLIFLRSSRVSCLGSPSGRILT